MPHMSQRKRKLIGAILLVISVVGWAILGTWGYLLLPEGLPGLVLIVYFIFAGMGWMIPAMILIRWMAKPNPLPQR
jgi:hypothetical protein